MAEQNRAMKEAARLHRMELEKMEEAHLEELKEAWAHGDATFYKLQTSSDEKIALTLEQLQRRQLAEYSRELKRAYA